LSGAVRQAQLLQKHHSESFALFSSIGLSHHGPVTYNATNQMKSFIILISAIIIIVFVHFLSVSLN
jgi:hypothetical protein